MPRETGRIRNCLLCDNVIQDIHNRYTLVGVFTNDVLVAEFPARIRLAFYGEFVVKQAGEYLIELSIDVDNNPAIKIGANVTVVNSDEVTALAVPNLDITIKQEVELTISVLVNKTSRPQTLIRKKIRRGVTGVPMASPQPAEQSSAVAPESPDPHD